MSAPVRWDDVTASTNETAMRLAPRAQPAWTLVAARHQTAGAAASVDRGSTGPAAPCSARRAASVSRRIASGSSRSRRAPSMADAADGAVGLPVRCKWPNDLVVDASKVGGILVESDVSEGAVRHVVVGSG